MLDSHHAQASGSSHRPGSCSGPRVSAVVPASWSHSGECHYYEYLHDASFPGFVNSDDQVQLQASDGRKWVPVKHLPIRRRTQTTNDRTKPFFPLPNRTHLVIASMSHADTTRTISLDPRSAPNSLRQRTGGHPASPHSTCCHRHF